MTAPISEPVLIIGATSGIGEALARALAASGTPLILAGRDLEELQRLADDLEVRFGAAVAVEHFEARDFSDHPAFYERCAQAAGGPLGGVIACQGLLVEQEEAQQDLEQALALIDVNLTSCMTVLNVAANDFEARGAGFICAVSSVAGDRGRQSNYIYGAAKGGLNRYLEGLRQRLAKAGVPVLTVKPGFVDTGMIYGREGLFLVAAPDRVAADITRAIRRRRNVIYTPWFWRWIMLVIRHVPEVVFKRVRL